MENKLATWLNTLLQKREWTMRELARQSGMSHAAISVVLSGQRKPTWEFCAKVADALKMSKVELFRMAGLMESVPEDIADEEELIHLTRHLARHDRRNLIIYARALVEADEQERRTQVVALDGLANDGNFGDVNKFDDFGPGAGQPGDRGKSEKCERCGGTVLGPGQR